jgi:hypothetical protein
LGALETQTQSQKKKTYLNCVVADRDDTRISKTFLNGIYTPYSQYYFHNIKLEKRDYHVPEEMSTLPPTQHKTSETAVIPILLE